MAYIIRDGRGKVFDTVYSTIAEAQAIIDHASILSVYARMFWYVERIS